MLTNANKKRAKRSKKEQKSKKTKSSLRGAYFFFKFGTEILKWTFFFCPF